MQFYPKTSSTIADLCKFPFTQLTKSFLAVETFFERDIYRQLPVAFHEASQLPRNELEILINEMNLIWCQPMHEKSVGRTFKPKRL